MFGLSFTARLRRSEGLLAAGLFVATLQGLWPAVLPALASEGLVICTLEGPRRLDGGVAPDGAPGLMPVGGCVHGAPGAVHGVRPSGVRRRAKAAGRGRRAMRPAA